MYISFGLLITFQFVFSSYARSVNDDKWNEWKREHGKLYHSPKVELERRTIWERNVAKIQEHNVRYNLGLVSYRQGINEFTDLTWDEFKRTYFLPKSVLRVKNSMGYNFTVAGSIPDKIDWRKKGAVQNVRTQGKCRSSWAMASIGALEGQYKLKLRKSASLSVQQLIDCSKTYGLKGCVDGAPELSYEYFHDFWSQAEKTYPYTEKDGDCVQDESQALLTVTGYYNVRSGNETVLRNLIAKFGPVAAIIGTDDGFQSYKDGIYSSSTCSEFILDYSVLIVGYGAEKDKGFWILKNSLGTSWGEAGYMRLARLGTNMCGIASDASVPLIKQY